MFLWQLILVFDYQWNYHYPYLTNQSIIWLNQLGKRSQTMLTLVCLFTLCAGSDWPSGNSSKRQRGWPTQWAARPPAMWEKKNYRGKKIDLPAAAHLMLEQGLQPDFWLSETVRDSQKLSLIGRHVKNAASDWSTDSTQGIMGLLMNG